MTHACSKPSGACRRLQRIRCDRQRKGGARSAKLLDDSRGGTSALEMPREVYANDHPRHRSEPVACDWERLDRVI